MLAEDDDALATALDHRNLAPTRLATLAVEAPDRIFLTNTSGASPTYSEAHLRMLRWCTFLRERGVGVGDRVTTMLPSSSDAILVWLALSMLRAYEVPINPELRGNFLQHIVSDAGVRLCIVRPEFVALVQGSGIYGLDIVAVDRAVDPLTDVDAVAEISYPQPSDVSCLIYTSGTTGPSKGVVVTWAQMTGFIGRVPRSRFGPETVCYAPWPMFHVTGRSPVVTMLDRGASVVCRERFSVSSFWSDVFRFGVTHASLAPVVRLLLDAPGPIAGEHPLHIIFGGSDARANLAFAERFAVEVNCNYGSTELGFPITNRFYDEKSSKVTGWPRRGYSVRGVDDTGTEVGIGKVGELHVHPPARELMLREYFRQPALTEAAIVDGWNRTGDTVRMLDNGAIVFVDRLRDTIRRFGENISSLAVEQAVVALGNIADCAAVGIRSEAAGRAPAVVCDADLYRSCRRTTEDGERQDP